MFAGIRGVKGYLQENGIDYLEVFAREVRFESLRFLLMFAPTLNYDIHQMDVTTAFLNGPSILRFTWSNQKAM